MKKWLCLALPALLLAVPSDWKEVKTFTQPDGSPVEARLIGDEHYSFFEDLEGHVLVRNNEGWFCYAELQDGLFVPTEHIYERSVPPAPPHIRPSADAVAARSENEFKVINQWLPNVHANERKLQLLGKADASSQQRAELLGLTGTNTLICLLAAFSDSGFGWNQAGETPAPALERWHFWGLGFGDSVPPLAANVNQYSMNNYYYQATYGQLQWTGDVDSIRNSGRTRSSANTSTTLYIRDACVAADPYVNFSNYDQDSDGYVDHLFVIHPGRGEEESGNATDIWSASYTGLNYGPYDGVYVNRAVVIPENAKVGVFCHELFHQYANAPDLYDYNYDGNCVGDFCLMDAGSWNGDPGGAYPAHMCGWLKYDTDGTGSVAGYFGAAALGDSAECANNARYYVTQLDSTAGSTLSYPRFYIFQNTALRDSSQSFLVENRQQTGTYESWLPRSGMLIYHRDRRMIGTRYNDGPPAYRYYTIWLERNLYDCNWYYYLSTLGGADTVQYMPNDHFAPYAADWGYIAFDTTSLPNCGRNYRSASGNPAWGRRFTGISNSDYVMSFNASGGTTPVSGAAVRIQSYTVKDPLISGYNNNANGLFDAGEYDTLIVTLFSSGANAAAVQESLYTSDPYVTILNPGRKNNGTMNNNTYAQDTYLVRVSFGTPTNYNVEFDYKVWATGFADSNKLYIPVNTPAMVYKFTPGAVLANHVKFKPMAIAVYRDTLFVSDGDSIGLAGATYRVYKFYNGALVTSAARPGNQSYPGAAEVGTDGNIYWSIGDSCVWTNRALTRQGAFRFYNSDWSASTTKRVRGITFAPSNAPTAYGACSLFTYWQHYTGTPAYEETLHYSSKPSSGTAVCRGRWVIPEGQSGDMNHWRNGRGLEHDGWRFWRICLFTSEIYRARAPVSSGGSMDTIFTMLNPNHWGAYPGYDIDFQAKNSAGGEPHTVYGRGNQFFLWTTNIDNGDIVKLNVTDVVLPGPVDNVTAAKISTTQAKIKWDNKNYATNPDTLEKVERYIIYRSVDPNLLGDSVGYVTASGSSAPSDSFINTLPLLRDDYYYRVSAVNYFGFRLGNSNVAGPIIGITEGDLGSGALTRLHPIAPNVLGRPQVLCYELSQPGQATLKVYSAIGALVRTLASGSAEAGRHYVTWNLMDEAKRFLPSGIYFVRYTTDSGYEETQKVIIAR